MTRRIIVALALLCVGCSTESTRTAEPKHAIPTPAQPPLYLQVSRYASQIAAVAKTVHDCASAEQKASPEHLDTTYMKDKEIGICGGDDKSVDVYLSFTAPEGFANTDAQVQSLRTDLKNP